MKIFYIEDQNGKYASEDGSRRFTRLEGTAAYEFLRSPMGQGRRFMKLANIDSDEDEINIEVNSNVMKSFRMYERREQYISDNAREKPYTIISLSYAECDDEEYPEESLPDEDVNIEEEVLRQIDLEILHRALDALLEDEYALIYALFLREKPMTESEYATQRGTTQQTISKRKKTILKKLRNYF